MRTLNLRWDDWSVEHIARHGVEPFEVEVVAACGTSSMQRAHGGRYAVVGHTDACRCLGIIVEPTLEGANAVITARSADPKERRQYLRRRHRT